MSEAMSEAMIPITLTSGQKIIGISCDKIKITWPTKTPEIYYFMVVVDRKTLSVVASETSTDLSTVPASVKKYEGNNGYLLLMVTFGLNNYSMPSGDLLNFLDKNGAGPGMAKLIQCSTTVGPSYGYYSYCLASTMGVETGFENYKIDYGSVGSGIIFLPLKLQKVGDFYTLTDVFPV